MKVDLVTKNFEDTFTTLNGTIYVFDAAELINQKTFQLNQGQDNGMIFYMLIGGDPKVNCIGFYEYQQHVNVTDVKTISGFFTKKVNIDYIRMSLKDVMSDSVQIYD